MLEKLEQLEKEYKEIQSQLSNPEVINNREKYTELSRKYKTLEKTAELAVALREAQTSLADAEEASSDPEMKELAEGQKKEALDEIARLEAEAEVELLPKDPNDHKNVIMEIRAGAGGDEAAIFASELMRMYMKYAEGKGFKIELIDKSEGDPGCIKEVIFKVAGGGAYGELKYESGVHRVQRIPVTESQGRIHTSASSVAVLPEAEEVDIEIRDEDLKIDVFRASGCGGQSVNTTDSAVRITHVPTGIVVSCQNERSQHQNKDHAMKVLRARLVDLMEKEKASELSELRGGKTEMSWGNQIRSYVLHPYKMVKDHRTDYEEKNPEAVLDGELVGFIEAELKKI